MYWPPSKRWGGGIGNLDRLIVSVPTAKGDGGNEDHHTNSVAERIVFASIPGVFVCHFLFLHEPAGKEKLHALPVPADPQDTIAQPRQPNPKR
jgi:hypothetical protein